MRNSSNKNKKEKVQNEILIYTDKKRQIEVEIKQETLWLNLNQIAYLFDVKKAAISKHIKKIYSSGELKKSATVSKKETVQIEGNRKIKRNIQYYNLDVIIAVGYRVNSKKATQFRIWATNVLKNYLIKGYVLNEKRINEKRLREIEKTIKLIKSNIKTHMLSDKEVKGFLEIIEKYTQTWEWIEKYDNGELKASTTGKEGKMITIEEVEEAKNKLRDYLSKKYYVSDLFGKERDRGLLESALQTIFQTFDGKPLYPSFEEKAANLLYMVIKNHPFIDGNKRIGALLFLMFLYKNMDLDTLFIKFSNTTLTALCYLVAASPPEQKKELINLIINFISFSEEQ